MEKDVNKCCSDNNISAVCKSVPTVTSNEKESETVVTKPERLKDLVAYNPRFNSNGNGPSNTGSTWSLNSSTASSGTSVIRWYRHPKVQEHWKVVAISFVLFFIGLCLCIAGVVLEALRVQLGGIFMLFVIGIICFIPGVYHVIAVYCAVKGKRGFSFYNLPLFN